MINPINIAEGFGRALIGSNKDISEARMKICRKCPIFNPNSGGICNKRLWFNPDNGDVSLEKKAGYIRGCGCFLKAKTTVASESCPANKW